jgi:hypothetical protein
MLAYYFGKTASFSENQSDTMPQSAIIPFNTHRMRFSNCVII